MKSILGVFLVLLLVGQEVRAQDPRALAAVEKTLETLGGSEGAIQTGYLRFDFEFTLDDFAFQSRHLWDRQEGRYRVEWGFGGRSMVALFNVEAPQEARIWVDGQPAPAAQLDQLRNAAYYRFLNETYWLLMPLKMKDPGVHLDYMGQEDLEGRRYDMVHLSFDEVGMTPGDQYWVYLNPETGLMDRFAYYLERFEGEPSFEEASVWNWRQWEDVGGVRLARERVLVRGPKEGKEGRVFFPLLTVLPRVVDAVFESPETPLP